MPVSFASYFLLPEREREREREERERERERERARETSILTLNLFSNFKSLITESGWPITAHLASNHLCPSEMSHSQYCPNHFLSFSLWYCWLGQFWELVIWWDWQQVSHYALLQCGEEDSGIRCALKRAIGNVMLFLWAHCFSFDNNTAGYSFKNDYIFTCDSQKYELFLILQNNECVF